MKHFRLFLLAFACAGLLSAQDDNPLSAEIKASYTRIKTNLLKAADKMSDENYAFKAADTIRPFGALIAHTSDSNIGGCGRIKGEQKRGEAASKTAKADLVAAFKESFAYCDAVMDSLKDSDLTQMVTTGQRKQSKQAMAWGLIVHDNEMYGTMCVYMRAKGVVPPSSEGR
jgi:hypothetical protein